MDWRGTECTRTEQPLPLPGVKRGVGLNDHSGWLTAYPRRSGHSVGCSSCAGALACRISLSLSTTASWTEPRTQLSARPQLCLENPPGEGPSSGDPGTASVSGGQVSSTEKGKQKLGSYPNVLNKTASLVPVPPVTPLQRRGLSRGSSVTHPFGEVSATQ